VIPFCGIPKQSLRHHPVTSSFVTLPRLSPRAQTLCDPSGRPLRIRNGFAKNEQHSQAR